MANPSTPFEVFPSFAKERLIKHHDVSKPNTVPQIKDMEWRHNSEECNPFY
jgi:hypothetical protein